MHTPRRLRPFGAFLALGAIVVSGCGLDLGVLSLEARGMVSDHEDSQGLLAAGAAAASLPVLALDATTVTLVDVVAAQSRVGELLDDPSCIEVETIGNEVRYTLERCRGLVGPFEVSGVQVARFEPGSVDRSLVIDVASEGLTVAGRPIEHAVRLEIAVEAEGTTLRYEGEFRGKAGARDVEHEVALEAFTSTEGHLSLQGSSSTKVGLRSLEVELDLLRRGPYGTCSEGTIVLRRPLAELEVTLELDGSTEYLARTNRGGSDTYELDCEPAQP